MTTRPRLLDLYCCQGGAATGYHRAGFDVTGVDHKPQPRYPFAFVQADALEYCAAHGHEYDAIHASPPCQRYSQVTPMAYKDGHPDLIDPTRGALQATGTPYVIENVAGARYKLRDSVMLCGTMFGLPVWRHRWFEIHPAGLWLLPPCRHDEAPVLISGRNHRGGVNRPEPTVAKRREAMKTPWMTIAGIDEAIPPAYTEWIGKKMMEAIDYAKR